MLTIMTAMALAAAAQAAPATAPMAGMVMQRMDMSQMDHWKMDHSNTDHSNIAGGGRSRHRADGKMGCDMSKKDASASEHQSHSH